jgi:hypothetical protein
VATTDVIFSGLYYAVGYPVSVSVCGLDCGDYTVDQYGRVTVPLNSDPDMLFNGAYIQQFDVGPFDTTTYGELTTRLDIDNGSGATITIFVPVCIGFAIPYYGKLLRLIGEDQTKSPQGGAMGKERRTQWVGALLRNTQGITFFTENSFQDTPNLAYPGQAPLVKNILFSGVWSRPLEDNWSLDSFVGFGGSRPYAASVVSLTAFLETSER